MRYDCIEAAKFKSSFFSRKKRALIRDRGLVRTCDWLLKDKIYLCNKAGGVARISLSIVWNYNVQRNVVVYENPMTTCLTLRQVEPRNIFYDSSELNTFCSWSQAWLRVDSLWIFPILLVEFMSKKLALLIKTMKISRLTWWIARHDISLFSNLRLQTKNQ